MSKEKELKSKDAYLGTSKVERSINYLKTQVRLAVDSQSRPVAIIQGNNNFAKSLNSQSFINEVRKVAYENGDIIKLEDVKEIISNLGAIAEFEDGGLVDVYQRVAFAGSGIEIDSGDSNHMRYRIENGDVSVLNNGSDVIFERTDTMLPYPEYTKGHDIKSLHGLLAKYVRLRGNELYLKMGWLCYTLATPRSQNTQYVHLGILGTMGSGKSFICKEVISRFVDPTSNPLNMFPNKPKDLAISAQSSHLQIIDNVRAISQEWSDIFCIFATSGVIKERALYTNAEEHSLKVLAPLVFNGIYPFITESDLASRTLVFHFSAMNEVTRLDERSLVSELKQDESAIFSCMLELIASVLNIIDTKAVVKHESRMMGFVRFLAGMEYVLDLEDGVLQKAFADNSKQTMLEGLIEDPFSHAIYEFAQDYSFPNQWTGPPAELLQLLTKNQPRAVVNSAKLWPQNAISQGKRLKVIEKTLDAQGIELVLGERGKERRIKLGMKAGVEEVIDEHSETKNTISNASVPLGDEDVKVNNVQKFVKVNGKKIKRFTKKIGAKTSYNENIESECLKSNIDGYEDAEVDNNILDEAPKRKTRPLGSRVSFVDNRERPVNRGPRKVIRRRKKSIS